MKSVYTCFDGMIISRFNKFFTIRKLKAHKIDRYNIHRFCADLPIAFNFAYTDRLQVRKV